MSRDIYINLAVADLAASKAFFRTLGFELKPEFTDDKAACMIINGSAYVMLLARPFFQTFTRRAICETATQTETLLAIALADRAAVDAMVHAAVAAGGAHAMPPMEHDFRYGWSFYDLDGHHWEVMAMGPGSP